MAQEAITQTYLKSILDYNPQTGVFVWKKFVGKKRNIKRYIGKIAGGKDNLGRMQIRLNDKYHRLHRLAWLYIYGNWPDGHIDHINMDQSDNRISNLRIATRSQNQCNRGIQTNNTSGFKGVSFSKLHNKWHSYIKIEGKRKHIGLYKSKMAAYFAYCYEAKKLHGDFARLS